MVKPRETKKEEFKNVVNLINHVFRTTRGHKPTMQEEFPLLLNENNVNNIIMIEENGMPAADVNFLKEDILVEGNIIKAASIGGVCTHENYRKKGYASLILDYVENKMYDNSVDVVLISGERNLYRRRGCAKVKNFYKYTIEPYDQETDLKIKDYEEKYLYEMINMYNHNSTKYYRTCDEFKALLNSATIPWGTYTYKKYALIKNGNLCGYVVLRLIDEDEKYGQVIECFGNPNNIFDSLCKIAFELNLEYINYYVHIKDKINQLQHYAKKEEDYLHGTVKIINFASFMEHLKPYFIQYVSKDIMDKVRFGSTAGTYFIQIDEEKLCISNIELLTKLVFEGAREDILCSALENKPKIKDFVNRVFPIPFIWTANLNYQ